MKEWGIILSIILILIGVLYPVPKKEIDMSYLSSAQERPWVANVGGAYVGGDAYNYQMEASLKAGYVSGVLAMKSISFVGGILLLFYTLFSLRKCEAEEAQARYLNDLKKSEKERKQVFEQILKHLTNLETQLDDINNGSKEEPIE